MLPRSRGAIGRVRATPGALSTAGRPRWTDGLNPRCGKGVNTHPTAKVSTSVQAIIGTRVGDTTSHAPQGSPRLCAVYVHRVQRPKQGRPVRHLSQSQCLCGASLSPPNCAPPSSQACITHVRRPTEGTDDRIHHTWSHQRSSCRRRRGCCWRTDTCSPLDFSDPHESEPIGANLFQRDIAEVRRIDVSALLRLFVGTRVHMARDVTLHSAWSSSAFSTDDLHRRVVRKGPCWRATHGIYGLHFVFCPCVLQDWFVYFVASVF